jgi:hypothetical protein
MCLTRTLASDAVLSVKSDRRKAINKKNKKLLRNPMHGAVRGRDMRHSDFVRSITDNANDKKKRKSKVKGRC